MPLTSGETTPMADDTPACIPPKVWVSPGCRSPWMRGHVLLSTPFSSASVKLLAPVVQRGISRSSTAMPETSGE